MKIKAPDEYGVRILARIAKCKDNAGISNPQLTDAEGLSEPNISKLTQVLRVEGLINSTKGDIGGYLLAWPAADITVNNVLKALGGRLFDEKFCANHSWVVKLCTNSIDCSIRSLLSIVQSEIDKITLTDLSNGEKKLQLLFKVY